MVALRDVDVHLRDLRYFVAVAEESHFRKAAERLFVSQPVVSRQIARLERELRVRLFERDRRRVCLTAAGEQLLDRARDLLSAWQRAEAEVRQAAAARASVLVVGQQTGLGRGLTQRLAAGLAEADPLWRMEVRQIPWTDPTAGVGSGECDVAFAWLGMRVDPTFAYAVVAEEPVVVAVGDAHPLAGRRQANFAEIADQPLVALPGEAGDLRSFWLAEHARAGAPAPVAAVATTADEALETVMAGPAAVLLAEGNAELYARKGLWMIDVPDLPPARLAFLWRPEDARATVRAAVAAMSERLHP